MFILETTLDKSIKILIEGNILLIRTEKGSQKIEKIKLFLKVIIVKFIIDELAYNKCLYISHHTFK